MQWHLMYIAYGIRGGWVGGLKAFNNNLLYVHIGYIAYNCNVDFRPAMLPSAPWWYSNYCVAAMKMNSAILFILLSERRRRH